MKEKELATRQESRQCPCEGTVWMEGDAQGLSELKPDACSLQPRPLARALRGHGRGAHPF